MNKNDLNLLQRLPFKNGIYKLGKITESKYEQNVLKVTVDDGNDDLIIYGTGKIDNFLIVKIHDFNYKINYQGVKYIGNTSNLIVERNFVTAKKSITKDYSKKSVKKSKKNFFSILELSEKINKVKII